MSNRLQKSHAKGLRNHIQRRRRRRLSTMQWMKEHGRKEEGKKIANRLGYQ